MSRELLDTLLTPEALTGVAPMLTLTVGLLLLLIVDIIPGAGKLRPVVFLASLVVAFVFEWRLLHDAPGSILGGTYIAGGVTALWGMIFLCCLLVAWLYGRGYYREERPFVGEHDALMLCAGVGMMLMAGAGDLLSFFIGLELLSVPLYALAGFRRARNDSVEAGLRYFVLGAFAAGLFLYGASLVYCGTGTIGLAELREQGLGSGLALVGIALIASSLFFKVSVFPFHFWVPDVYQGSPTPVTTFMATGTKAAGFAFLLNACFLLPPSAAATLSVIAILTMAIGNLGALVQRDFKRLLGYSAVAHAGTILLAVVAGISSQALQGQAVHATLFYMAAYVFTAGGAFGLIALLESDGDRFTKLDSLKGLARRRPGVAAAMTLFMLSLGGIPATGGFLGKWFVFSTLVAADMLALAIVGILMSVVALGYYLRVIVAMYMEEAPEDQAPPTTTRLSATVATSLCATMVLVLGVLPKFLLDLLAKMS